MASLQPQFNILCVIYTKGKVISGTDQVSKQNFVLDKIKTGFICELFIQSQALMRKMFPLTYFTILIRELCKATCLFRQLKALDASMRSTP